MEFMAKTVLTRKPSVTNLDEKRAKRISDGGEVLTNKKMS